MSGFDPLGDISHEQGQMLARMVQLHGINGYFLVDQVATLTKQSKKTVEAFVERLKELDLVEGPREFEAIKDGEPVVILIYRTLNPLYLTSKVLGAP